MILRTNFSRIFRGFIPSGFAPEPTSQHQHAVRNVNAMVVLNMASGSEGDSTQSLELDGQGPWTIARATERKVKRIKYGADDKAAHMV